MMDQYIITLWTSLEWPTQIHIWAADETDAMVQARDIARSDGLPEDLDISITQESGR